MAFRQGRYAEITVSGIALSAYADSIDFSRDTDMLETTTFTKRNKTFLTGLTDNKIDIAGKYDPTVAVGPQAVLHPLIGANHSIPVFYYPGGNTAGQVVRTFNAYVQSYNESAAVGDVVAWESSLQIDGEIVTTVSGA